jgi:hypothetical protein
MTNNWFYIPAVLVGIAAFILFVLSVAVAESWLTSASLWGISEAAFAVYGILSSSVAVGCYILSRED